MRDQLEKQLSFLTRQGTIETWHDRRIGAGEEFVGEIDAHLEASDIILLLVSSDFLASDYCYDVEMNRALERHDEGTAIVIPVILRPCMWKETRFGKLLAATRDGTPVTQYPDLDVAFLEVAESIKGAAERFARRSASPVSTASEAPSPAPVGTVQPVATMASPRSSNLRLAKTFTDRDKDKFRHETFDYIAAFFSNSVAELSSRNDGIEGDVRRVDANRFTAAVYRQGKAIARCTVFIGSGFFGNGIAYSNSETMGSNSCNETLSVEADDQTLYLTSMGFAVMRGRGDEQRKLSQEGAAELYWSMFIEPLQRGS